MLISDSHQFVFVHIRKAAGISLRQILERVSLPKNNQLPYKLLSRNGFAVDYHRHSFRKHANLIEVQRSMPADKFKQYFKFAVVRNPWDRLVSEYEYIKTQPAHSRFKKLSAMNFAQFVAYQSQRPAAHQINALRLSDGQLGCDFIGKLEALQQSLKVVGAKTGVDFSALPHTNQVDRRDYRTYYDTSLQVQVEKLWQVDIEVFQYDFDTVDS